MNKNLAVIGASGHGKVVAEIAEALGYKVSFFDDAFPEKKQVEHWPIKGNLQELLTTKAHFFGAAIAIGNAQVRQKIITELYEHNISMPVLVHPTASVSRYAEVEEGCVVMPGAVINAFTVLGKGCIINSNAVVEHDCNFAGFVHVCPSTAIAGGTTIGERTWVGIGSSVRQLINIGADVLIGAGSVVVNDIPDKVTVVGAPAKIMNK